jgi:anti-sigma factor RsiW
MKCEKMRKWMLLADSGELSAGRKARLEKHVAKCPQCAAYQRDITKIMRAARAELVEEDPPAAALEAVKRAAASRVRPARDVKSAFAGWAPRLALAASLFVAAAVWVLRSAPRDGREVAVVVKADSTESGDASAVIDEALLDLALLGVNGDPVPKIERLSDLKGGFSVSLVDRELMILDGLAM